jgi:hypothetical protein
MIIDDLNTLCMPISPEKANSPLVIDANAMLPLAIPFERLKPIRRRQPEIFQPDCCVNRVQLHKCPLLNLSRESFHEFSFKDSLGVGIAKGLNHGK